MDRQERATFGPLIKQERERLGMSQTQLADAAGTTQRTIGYIERGERVAQTKVLIRILNALGLDTNGLPKDPIDDELETLIAVVRPFLATLDSEHRAAVMPKLVEALVREMRVQVAEELRTQTDAPRND